MDTVQQSLNSAAMDMQADSGLPLLETLVILAVVNDFPEMMKAGVVTAARDLLGADQSENGRYLKFVDNMLRVGLICKHDFKYHMTPRGERHLIEITAKIMPSLRNLVRR